MADKKLGKGLDFLIKRTTPARPAKPDTATEEAARVASPPTADERRLPVQEITPNPYQPRRVFDIDALNDLIESIRQHGVLQPIAVRRTAAGFELISGERRWRACQELGLEAIPAIVHPASNQQMLEFALIENIQREDLDPMEKARAYRKLIEKFELTQEAAAERLSQKRPTVANYLRLLDLPDDVQERVAMGTLSMGHARALLSLPDQAAQSRLAREVIAKKMSVRDVERRVQGTRPDTPRAPRPNASPHIRDVERRFREALGTKVAIQGNGTRGKIVISYFDTASLNRVLDRIEDGFAAAEE